MNNDTLNELIREEKRLTSLIDRLEKNLAAAPEGSLRINNTDGRKPAFYQFIGGKETPKQSPNSSTSSTYIPKDNCALAKKLAQKGYDEKMLGWARSAEYRLNKLIESYNHNRPEIIYNSLSDIRQSLVTPYYVPDDEFLESWLGKWILNRNTIPKKDEIYSERGEQMRSKSEKIIADRLYAEGIPYVYEPELILDDGERVYPDFAILNVRTRKEYLFEHFGRMDEIGYCKKNIRRIEEYALSGYVLGDNLLATFETNGNLFDPRYLDVLVTQYLK